MTYELYGHGGVGIIVDVMTDNKNRISSDMRIATNKGEGPLPPLELSLLILSAKG